MQLKDYLDVDKLERYVEEGIVNKRFHRTLPLTIYCYSRRATYENIWDEITTKTRGLIVDAQGTVCGRPFEKFFNLNTPDRPETHIENLPTDVQPIGLDKLDGNLGVIWRYGSFTGVASKGSFQSDHADWANLWYEKNCQNPQWPEGYTPVVEMICQCVQRHVVSYNEPDQLVLLALINNETGEELSYNEVYYWAYLNGLRAAEVFGKSVEEAAKDDRENKEGYVYSYPRPGQVPLKVKIKHETFLKLQKIVHSASPYAVYEALRDGNYDTLTSWVENSPDTLARQISDTIAELNERYGFILIETSKLYLQARNSCSTRKEFAEFVLGSEVGKNYSGVVFAIADGKSKTKIIWKIIGRELDERYSKPYAGFVEDDATDL